MVDCLAEVDVLALLEAVAVINNFTKGEAAIGIVVDHANIEDEVMLGNSGGGMTGAGLTGAGFLGVGLVSTGFDH